MRKDIYEFGVRNIMITKMKQALEEVGINTENVVIVGKKGFVEFVDLGFGEMKLNWGGVEKLKDLEVGKLIVETLGKIDGVKVKWCGQFFHAIMITLREEK